MLNKLLFTLLLVTILTLSIQAKEPFTLLPESEMQRLFTQFSRQHVKLYGTSEIHERRYQIFKANVEKARFENYITGRENLGITRFSDLTPEEFKSMFLMKTKTPREAREILIGKKQPSPATAKVTIKQLQEAPKAFDWREHQAVTPVKDQGSCGSCWTFSTTGNIEGMYAAKTGKLVSLSEQQLVDCDHNCVVWEGEKTCNSGCNGGLMWSSFEFIIKTGGLVTEDSYPYEAVNGRCRFNVSNAVVKISNWTFVSTHEDEMSAWLANNGPIAVAINADYLQYYRKGILNPSRCDPEELNHGVLIVGYGEEKAANGKIEQYWIVKNSWSTSWGEKGYFRLLKGKGVCGINQVPSTALI
ncbi:hypothetical protein C9374_005337 [Naegleria lovaniensis]|uniref:Uncharacterized protein n=1 Tax=Naegleria lovaniensis TaxID=51637 RepID=A0AA88KIZ9_NAELO|nr:uncharacterized protein C9374_005337 [Naegleria lovaniensis]KAG2382757.1 hypothetical protein C9374_005337 [Naegleria lovaniensis]